MPFTVPIPQYNTGARRVAWSPGALEAAVDRALAGNWSLIHSFIDRMAVDAYVAGCLTSRYSGVMRDYTIDPFDDTQADIDRADWLKTVIEKLKPRLFFRSILRGRMYRWNVIDLDWMVIDGKQQPVAFREIPRDLFEFGKDGNLKYNGNSSLSDIPPEVLTCLADQTPVLLPVTFDFYLKKFVLENWAGFLERFGEPMVIGRYPYGASKEFKDELEDAVESIARAASGILPDGGLEKVIDIIETGRNTGDQNLFEHRCNKSISVGILGHADAVENNTGMQIGSNPTEFVVREDLKKDDMHYIDENLQPLIDILYTRNFGDDRIPRFQMDKSDPVNVDERLKVLEVGYKHGLKLYRKNYEELGLEFDEEQQIIEKTAPAMEFGV